MMGSVRGPIRCPVISLHLTLGVTLALRRLRQARCSLQPDVSTLRELRDRKAASYPQLSGEDKSNEEINEERM